MAKASYEMRLNVSRVFVPFHAPRVQCLHQLGLQVVKVHVSAPGVPVWPPGRRTAPLLRLVRLRAQAPHLGNTLLENQGDKSPFIRVINFGCILRKSFFPFILQNALHLDMVNVKG